MDALFRPLDAARVQLLHALGPVSRALVVSREQRVAVGALLAVVTALVLATGAPMWTLALGPLVLGVPHVVADVRYLVVRAGLGAERRLVAVVALPLAVAACGGGTRAGFVAVAAALLASARGRSEWQRSAAGLALLAPLTFLAWHAPARADAAFAHLHNLVAVGLWWGWRRPGERAGMRWIALGAMALATLAILSGALDPLVSAGLGWRSRPAGFGVSALASALAPDVSTRWALRLVVLYAFGQSIHYAIWLRLVPDEDRERATPRTFRASWQALTRDVGPWVLAGAGLAIAFFACWALVSVSGARDGYLRAGAFHGHLELVALAVFFVRGRMRA
ncbi:MAG: hypothetical protein JWP97_4058 [Labilithrix sp.]|nr:hypothetical protein [Labilithrix sp.]